MLVSGVVYPTTLVCNISLVSSKSQGRAASGNSVEQFLRRTHPLEYTCSSFPGPNTSGMKYSRSADAQNLSRLGEHWVLRGLGI